MRLINKNKCINKKEKNIKIETGVITTDASDIDE